MSIISLNSPVQYLAWCLKHNMPSLALENICLFNIYYLYFQSRIILKTLVKLFGGKILGN